MYLTSPPRCGRWNTTLNETLTHREASAKGYSPETALAQNRLQVRPVPLFRVAKLPPTFFDEVFWLESNADTASIFEPFSSDALLLSRSVISVPRVRFIGLAFRERLWRD